MYKHGASTGVTEDFLTRIHQSSRGLWQVLPRPTLDGMFLSSSPSSASSSLPTPEQDGTMAFSMFIKWTAPDKPFPAPGDSGSLIYTFFDNSIVPLGILYGSDGDESYACLLYS